MDPFRRLATLRITVEAKPFGHVAEPNASARRKAGLRVDPFPPDLGIASGVGDLRQVAQPPPRLAAHRVIDLRAKCAQPTAQSPQTNAKIVQRVAVRGV